MKIRPTDIVLMIIAVIGMIYLFFGISTTWYPQETAQEIEKQYLQQQEEAKRWP